MKNIVFLALLAAALPFGSLRAQEYRTDINPALLYYQAFLVSGKGLESEREYLFTNEWRGRRLEGRFTELLAGYNHSLTFVRRAARSKVACDWGIDIGDGPYTLLPHLSQVKQLAQAARLATMEDLQNGDQSEARDNLLGALAMGRNGARDGTLISALVQIAVESIVCETIAENYFQLSNETLHQLEEGFDAAPAREVVSSRVTAERGMFVDGWLAARFEAIRMGYPHDKSRAWKALVELLDRITDSGDKSSRFHIDELASASGATVEGAQKLVKEMGPYYDRLAAVLALPYREFPGPSDQLAQDIKRSENPFVREFLPAFAKSRGREFVVQVKLAMVRAAIEYRLRGQEGLRTVTDPCGSGPFGFAPFVFEGLRRGFRLTSAYAGDGFSSLIFVEKPGPPFYVGGKDQGQAPAAPSVKP